MLRTYMMYTSNYWALMLDLAIVLIIISVSEILCKKHTVFLVPTHHFSSYLYEGFLHLENIVGQSIIEWKCNITGCDGDVDPPVAVRVSLQYIRSWNTSTLHSNRRG